MDISNFGIFSDLGEAEKARIESSARKANFSQGETIVTKGARIEFVYFIDRGRVKESTCTRSGKEIVYNVFSRGDCFGLVWGFDVEYSKSDFIANRDCELYAVSIGELKEMARENPRLLNSVLSEVTRVARKYSDKLYEIRALDVPERTRAELLRHVLDNPDANGTEITVIANLPTHEEIANTIFTHREAVTREISNLIRRGVITRMENNLLAANVRLLQELVTDYS